jgi:hypothetical protein
VMGRGYGDCTDEGYVGLFGHKAQTLRRELGLPAKTNVRNHLTRIDLSQ